MAGRHAMSTGETVDQAVQLCGKSGEVPLQYATRRNKQKQNNGESLIFSLSLSHALSLSLPESKSDTAIQ